MLLRHQITKSHKAINISGLQFVKNFSRLNRDCDFVANKYISEWTQSINILFNGYFNKVIRLTGDLFMYIFYQGGGIKIRSIFLKTENLISKCLTLIEKYGSQPINNLITLLINLMLLDYFRWHFTSWKSKISDNT